MANEQEQPEDPTKDFFEDIKDLLLETRKEERLRLIVNLKDIFKKHHTKLSMSKLSIWYKKYEQELLQRQKLEAKVQKI